MNYFKSFEEFNRNGRSYNIVTFDIVAHPSASGSTMGELEHPVRVAESVWNSDLSKDYYTEFRNNVERNKNDLKNLKL